MATRLLAGLLRRPAAVILAALIPVGSLAGPASAAPSSESARSQLRPAASSAARPDWTPCHTDFWCARVRAPLDYDHPTGAQISVAVIKLPATDQVHRIGSLFVNPGGPGGSGVDFVLDAGPTLFTPQVRARFDIVGFDPRGISCSTPLQCFDTQAQAEAAVPHFPYPNSRAKTRVWMSAERWIDAACANRAGPILDHMTTADTARDLDRLRQAVGDPRLTYYGLSYGSFLGTVYANLFPDRVRALAVDGVLDPIAWTTGRGDQGRRVPFTTRLRSAVGAQATLRQDVLPFQPVAASQRTLAARSTPVDRPVRPHW